MEEIFKPQSFTIGELLGNKDSLYQIPRYQRPYSWGNDQLSKLWDDLISAKEYQEFYFLGSIITAKPEEQSKYLDIVDGQQRLTTLVILLCVCRDLFPELNNNDQADPSIVDNAVIKSSIKLNDRFERLRLRTHSNHASDFQNIIITEGNAIQNRKPSKKDLAIESAPEFRFENTANFFKEKFEELGEHESGQFINYLFNRVKIIRIDCQSVNFAIQLFQVLNDRGLDLSNSDLIKSYLLEKILKRFDGEDELKKQHENQFMDDWKACENYANEIGESMNNLFVMFEYYLLAKNPSRSLYDELKDLFKNRDANDVIQQFCNFIKAYKYGIVNSKDPVIYSMFYLRWSFYWKTIAITALISDYYDFKGFMKVFRRYYYLNWLAGNTLSRIKQTSFNLIGYLKEGCSLQSIKDELDKQLNNGVIKRAIDNLNGDIYGEAWCKPLLFMIEYEQLDNPTYFEMGDRTIQTEHILPKAWSKVEGWNYANSIPFLDDWINTGANLTLLSGTKNLDARNYEFPVKITSYDGTGLEHGDRKISSFKITQLIVNDYQSGKFNKTWDVDALNSRWTWFCDEIEKILAIDLTEIKSNLIKTV